MPPEVPMPEEPRSPNPQVFIEGQLYRSSTFPTNSSGNDLPFIDDNDNTPLDQMLRIHRVESADPRSYFWSEKLLRHILSRKRILAQLLYHGLRNANFYLNLIRPEDNKSSQTYLKTFAILTLFERGDEIPNFINDQVSDQSLPLCRHSATSSGQVELCHRSRPTQPLECFRITRWKTSEKEGFEENQWRLLTPYFEFDAKGSAQHYPLDEKAILPWCKKSNSNGVPHVSMQPSGQGGGFGSVSAIKIDPCSHGFREILQKLHLNDNLFALKLLHDQPSNDEGNFKHELEQLRYFNGLANQHLITLLATFTISKKYHFIFPYADSTLEYYWEEILPRPTMDLETVLWVSKQLSGIMSAIHIIHEPDHLASPERRYGRHGDIKPDNILWFRSSDDEKGILVVTDMGLSALHRDNSRSGIPRYKIPKVPGYQPPECDVKGGKISRAYDIWTLGCLYLEILTWLMGGWAKVDEFQRKRKAVYITGTVNNIFFTLKTIKGQEGYIAQVKTQVTEWFLQLHRDENCPQFIHDALDIIQQEMLVVLSKDRERSSARDLKVKFGNLHTKCLADRDYCIKGKPIIRPYRKATAVEAILRDDAIEAIRDLRPDMQEHDPITDREIRKSMLPTEFENMDINE